MIRCALSGHPTSLETAQSGPSTCLQVSAIAARIAAVRCIRSTSAVPDNWIARHNGLVWQRLLRTQQSFAHAASILLRYGSFSPKRSLNSALRC